jgi:hypothetical protein
VKTLASKEKVACGIWSKDQHDEGQIEYKLNTKSLFVDPFGHMYMIGATVQKFSGIDEGKSPQEKELDKQDEKVKKEYRDQKKEDNPNADIDEAVIKQLRVKEERRIKLKNKQWIYTVAKHPGT